MVIYEYGGAAAHAGLMTLALPGARGRVTPEQVRAAAEPSTKVADQRAVLLSLEDTHNSSGGRVWPLDELDEVVGAAREVGLAAHLDGARLLNASVALGVAALRDRRALRHRDALSVEGPRVPARRVARWLARADGARVAREAPVRRSDAAGGDRRGGRRLRARPSRRAARGGPRARALAGGGAPRSWCSRRPRSGRDELRPDRRGTARPLTERGARPAPAGGRRALRDDPPDGDARGHAPRCDGRRTSRRRRGSCPKRCWRASRRSQRPEAAGSPTRPLGYQRRSFACFDARTVSEKNPVRVREAAASRPPSSSSRTVAG